MKKQMLTLSFLGFLGILFVSIADAAPTVKKLGMSNNTVRTTANTNTGSVAKVDSASGQRLSSVRLNAAKPVKTTTAVTTAKTAKVSGADTNESRLSLGKYLHGANVTKTGTSVTPGTAGVVSGDFKVLEENVESVKSDFEDHIKNTDIHVSAEEKETWNAKQDALTPSDSVRISNDGVITSVMLLPVGSENAKPTAPIWIQ